MRYDMKYTPSISRKKEKSNQIPFEIHLMSF